jgi:HSP20 family protein
MSSKPVRVIRGAVLDPFREVENRFWERFARPAGSSPVPDIKIDLSEDDAAYHVKAEVPGVKKEGIRVTVARDRVSISAEIKQEEQKKSGERVILSERSASQSRVFTLPQDIDSSRADAKYEDGVLNLTLPKKAGHTATDVKVQ